MNQASIDKLFKSYPKDVRGLLFPNGKKELELILSSLSFICNIDSQTLNFDSMKTLGNVYLDTCIRKTARDEDTDIILDMPKKHHEYVKSIDDACKVMAYLVLHSQNPDYEIKEVIDEDTNDLSQMYLDSFKFMKANEGKENKFLKDTEYGLVAHKPIFTHGQTGTELYFGALMGGKDQELIYEYEDTLEVNGVAGFVDVYTIKEDGKDDIVARLYFNRYGNFNSSKAPKGFKLKKVDIEEALEHSRANVRKELKKSTIVEIITSLIVLAVILYLLIKK